MTGVPVTRDQLVERLAAMSPRARGDDGYERAPRAAAGLIDAAVLVPIVDRPQAMTVLLTRRTENLNDHAGQISFPGGRIEPTDADPEAAALRETSEEVGLDRDRVALIGRLDTYTTRTGFRITPVVGIVSPPFALRLDPVEVVEAFEVPLGFVLDPANHQRRSRRLAGELRHFYVLSYREHDIWGATAGMLVNLAQVLTRRPAG